MSKNADGIFIEIDSSQDSPSSLFLPFIDLSSYPGIREMRKLVPFPLVLWMPESEAFLYLIQGLNPN